MYKAKIISKKDLIDTYGGEARLWGFERGNPEYSEFLTLPPLDNLEVEMLSVGRGNGPYTIIKLLDIPRAANHIIVPSSLVKVIELPTAAEKYTEILDRVIGAGRWKYLESESRLILLYPEINITNTLGHKHLIRDLIVAVPLTVKGAINRMELFGLRTTMTDQERAANYNHSHLSGSTGRAQPFCLGSKEFPNYMARLNRVLLAEEFELFLVNLKEYLSWESIEGRPYTLISNIGKAGVRAPEYQSSYPNYTGYTVLEERQVDKMARYVVRMLRKYPQLVSFSSNGWALSPALDPTAYFDIEASLYEGMVSEGAIRTKYFADYDKATGGYMNTAVRSRSSSRIELDGVAYTWAQAVKKLDTKIIPTEDTPLTATSIKMPFPLIRIEIVRRANFYLARARQQLNKNGEGSVINDKAQSTHSSEPSQSDRVHAQPVS